MLPPEFHFLRPVWLLALPVLLLLSLWLARSGRDGRRWEAVCDPTLLPHVLLARRPGRPRRWPAAALAVATLLVVVALAGPTWERLPQPVFRSQSAVVLALDLSRSMSAADLAPSRLERARFALRDLLAARQDGQTGLVVFAADAFAVSPLTDDTATIEAQLPALEPGIMPAQGSRPDRAIALAAALLDQAGAARGEILLVTDGAADEAAAAAAARDAAGRGHRVSVVGVGTPAGAPIPSEEGGFVTDGGGGIVIPRLDHEALGSLAAAGDGVYVGLEAGGLAPALLADRWDRTGAKGIETGRLTDTWLDRGPWVAALALPLVLLGFRRGVLVVAALALLPLAPEARAAGWDDLWSRPDQQGAAALAAGDAERARRLFEDRRWRGVAAYRAGDYEAAAAALEGLEDPESLYNLGNALARAGRLDEAIASYEQTLARAPDHEDARHNLELLRSLQEPAAGGGSGAGDRGEPAPSDDPQDGDPAEGEPGADAAGDRSSPAADGQRGDGAAEGADPAAETGRASGEQGDPDRLAAAERAALDRQAAAARAQAGSSAEPSETAMPAGTDPLDEASPDTPPDRPPTPGRRPADPLADEAAQATEQWLRRIPDDPGGLLRRKFYYQYRERGAEDDAGQERQTW